MICSISNQSEKDLHMHYNNYIRALQEQISSSNKIRLISLSVLNIYAENYKVDYYAGF